MNVDGRTFRLVCFAAVACPLILMILLSMTPGISFTEDLGRHLVIGKIIYETGCVPETNLLTYTYPDFPFLNHHWLSELCMYLVHSAAGINGLIVLKMVMSMLALGLAIAVIRPDPGAKGGAILQPAVLWICAILSAVIIGFRSHIRPELATFLFIALLLFLFERVRMLEGKGRKSLFPRAAMIFSMLLWANLHIYFIFGIGMIGAFALERILEERTISRLRMECLWFAGTILASSATPYGIKGFFYPFMIFSNYGLQITENMSPAGYFREMYNPMLFALPILSVILAAALACRIWTFCAGCRRGSGFSMPAKFADFPICLAALAAAWTMVRSVPLLALCAIPAIMFAAREMTERFNFSGLAVKRAVPLLIIPLLAFSLWLSWTVVEGSYSRIFPSPISPTPFGLDDDARYGGLRRLQSSSGLSGPVFNDYNIGSLVEYQLFPERAYCDNRPEAFPASFWKNEYEPAIQLGPGWKEISKLRSFNAVIVSTTGVKEPFFRILMADPGWKLVYLDDICGVWARTVPGNSRIIRDCSFDEKRIDRYARKISEDILVLGEVPFYRRQVEAAGILFRLYGLICIGREDLAWPYVWQMHLIYPDYDMLYELIKATAPPDMIPEVERILAEKARWPLSSGNVTSWAGHLIATGRRDEARKILLRGRIFFPFSRNIKANLETLQ